VLLHVGVSNVDIDELAAAMTATDIASVQNEYNLLERSSDGVLEICEKRQLAFIPYYQLPGGALARRKPPPMLATIARRHGATPAQVALAWLLRHSHVMIPIPGTCDWRTSKRTWPRGGCACKPQRWGTRSSRGVKLSEGQRKY